MNGKNYYDEISQLGYSIQLLGEKLQVLLEHKGKALTREQLVELIWGIEFMGDDRTVDSYIKILGGKREKVKATGFDHSFIKTVWVIGYKAD